MKGINNSEHQQLISSLLKLEILLRSDFEEDTDRHRAAKLRKELVAMHEKYNSQLAALGVLIGDYHELFKKAKHNFLSPKLKKLRKKAACDTVLD